MGVIFLGFLGIVAVLVLWTIGFYNRLVALKQQINSATADIKAILKQRFNTIPNLVEIVKGYAKHEKGTLTEVTKMRSAWQQAIKGDDVSKLQEADKQMTGVLSRLIAVAENYPDLKADKNFKELMQTLTDLEDKIQKARRYYNAVVEEYNTKITQFPGVLIANILGFKPAEYFDISEQEAAPVKVSF